MTQSEPNKITQANSRPASQSLISATFVEKIPELVYGILLYFGAYLVLIGYLVALVFKGHARKPLLIGITIHTFWNLAVWGFVLYSWEAGYSEYYFGWALVVPVNIVSAIYYA